MVKRAAAALSPIRPLPGSCQRCTKRHGCDSPCAPVADFLSLENRKPFEKDLPKEEVTILFPRRREIHQSVVEAYKDGSTFKPGQANFSDVQEIAFVSTKSPRLKQTGIFIDRFFFRMSYHELAEKYQVERSAVAKLYVNAKERLVKTIEAMDRVELAKNNGVALAAMPKAVRVFMLHAIFGLSNAEIGKFLGMHHSLVHRCVTSTRDRILAGELDLLTAKDDDRQAARTRLQEARQARAEYDRNRERPPRRRPEATS